MFPDIGLGEVLVVALVILLVAKPEDIPVFMRKLGIFMAHVQNFLRGMWGGMQEENLPSPARPAKRMVRNRNKEAR